MFCSNGIERSEEGNATYYLPEIAFNKFLFLVESDQRQRQGSVVEHEHLLVAMVAGHMKTTCCLFLVTVFNYFWRFIILAFFQFCGSLLNKNFLTIYDPLMNNSSFVYCSVF